MKWKLLPKWLKIMLLVFSMMTLIVVATIGVYGCHRFQKHKPSTPHYVEPKVVENITGIRLPKYKMVCAKEATGCFSGVWYYGYLLEFKRLPSDAFYEKLDQVIPKTIENGKTLYSFERIWGHGVPAPEGEPDYFFCQYIVTIEKESKEFTIKVWERD